MAENRLGSLAKQTAIYGLSSIIGRFLNYLLVPLYTYKIAAESGGYGIVTNLYAYTALLLVILTFGMETTFFRFSNKEGVDPNKAFSTSGLAVGLVSLIFIALVSIFLNPISNALHYADHPEFVEIMAIIVALDAFQAILFARLRYENKAVKFATLKLLFIFLNIGLNLFIFLVAPGLKESHPGLMGWYENSYQVGYIFIVNLICTGLITLGFIPEIKKLRFGIDRKMLKQMLRYTWPLLLLGLAGILNQVADKICYRFIVPGEEGDVQLPLRLRTLRLWWQARYRRQGNPSQGDEILHHFHFVCFPRGGDVHADSQAHHQERLLGGPSRSAHRDDGRDFHGYLFQPLVLVQAHRRNMVGGCLQCHWLCGVVGHQLHLCAKIRLYGLRLGRFRWLWHLYDLVVFCGPKESSYPLRPQFGFDVSCCHNRLVLRPKTHPC